MHLPSFGAMLHQAADCFNAQTLALSNSHFA
jgi:hypothetical protein